MKKILLCLASTTFLFACGGSSEDSSGNGQIDPPTGIAPPETIPPVTTPPVTLPPVTTPPVAGDIHNDVPAVDYNNARGIIEYVSFENRNNGTYTEDMFDADFNNSWETINGKVSIVTKSGDQKLSVTVPKGQYKKGIWAGKDLNEHEEIYFSYQIKFDNNFDFSMGGKMPGLAGLNKNTNYNPSGCKAEGQRADEGFSLRTMFRENGRAIGYFYHQNNPNLNVSGGKKNCGEEIDYQHNGKNFSFQRNKTYLIEQYVKMNDANQSNGIVTIHVNGHKVLERKNMVFGESRLYAINHLFIYLWHGGNNDRWAVDRDSTAYMDNFALSTEPLSYSK